MCFSLCLLPPVLSLDTIKKNLSLSPSLPPLWYPYTLMRPALSLQAEQSQLSQPYLSEEKDLMPSSSFWPVNILSSICPCLLCTGKPRIGPNTQVVASLLLSKGQGLPTSTCWEYSAYCSHTISYCHYNKVIMLAHCWLIQSVWLLPCCPTRLLIFQFPGQISKSQSEKL